MVSDALQSSKLKSIAQEVGRAQSLISSGNHGDAREVLQKANAEGRRLGLESPYILWTLAIASDYLQDHESSTRYIQEAITLDPLSPQLRHSFDIIASNIRQALQNSERTDDDPQVPVLYELLLRIGEADLDSHLRMAQWHLVRGNLGEARALLSAASLLFPSSPIVWTLLSKVAAKQGDMLESERCQKSLASLGPARLPSFVMEQAQG
jgi:tetratricopeptide (TPR) repeat protein